MKFHQMPLLIIINLCTLFVALCILSAVNRSPIPCTASPIESTPAPATNSRDIGNGGGGGGRIELENEREKNKQDLQEERERAGKLESTVVDLETKLKMLREEVETSMKDSVQVAPMDGGSSGGGGGGGGGALSTFAMLQPDQGIKSLVIEIGLDDTIMTPKPEQFIIGVEASIKSLCEGFNLSRERTALLSAAMGDHVGMADWYERAGWMAANSMAKQDTLVDYHGPTKAVTSITAVPVVSLHTLITNVPASMPIALLKIDAQAHNYYIIAGAGELIKRAAVIFSECTVDMASDGQTGASVFGDENDNCSNIRMYLEAKGFTFMGGMADDSTDKSMDIMFAQPKYIAAMKPCFTENSREFGDPKSMPKWKAEDCFHEKITPIVHMGRGAL